MRSDRTESSEILERLMELRSNIAESLGYSSYASIVLSNRMARTPESVWEFLGRVRASIGSRVESELNALRLSNIADWDRLYIQRVQAQGLEEYFSLGNCVAGLAAIGETLFGLEISPGVMHSGEGWKGLVRLDVKEKATSNLIGHLYLDPHNRNFDGSFVRSFVHLFVSSCVYFFGFCAFV
jgi:Zn-dependent oligopeptidase